MLATWNPEPDLPGTVSRLSAVPVGTENFEVPVTAVNAGDTPQRTFGLALPARCSEGAQLPLRFNGGATLSALRGWQS